MTVGCTSARARIRVLLSLHGILEGAKGLVCLHICISKPKVYASKHCDFFGSKTG